MYKKNIIAFTGGGTGGHVFPGLSIIEELHSDMDVLWIGSSKGSEKSYVSKAGIPFYGVPAGKLRRYFSLKNALDVFKVLAGIIQAKKLLKNLQPKILVSIGGYVSIPAVIAAHSLKIPVISVVCDLSLGLATKVNAYFSSSMLFTYEETLEKYLTSKIAQKQEKDTLLRLGMPIRKSTVEGTTTAVNKTYKIPAKQKVLLVLGGSSGSAQINDIVAKILPHLSKDITVLHQCGHQLEEDINKSIPQITKGMQAQYIPTAFFTDNYGSVLKRADVALARAGSGTLWELINASVPAIIVPLPATQSRGDQIENAKYFAKAGAIENLGPDPDINNIVKTLQSLLYEKKHSTKLKTNCRSFSTTHASLEYAKIIEKIAHNHTKTKK